MSGSSSSCPPSSPHRCCCCCCHHRCRPRTHPALVIQAPALSQSSVCHAVAVPHTAVDDRSVPGLGSGRETSRRGSLVEWTCEQLSRPRPVCSRQRPCAASCPWAVVGSSSHRRLLLWDGLRGAQRWFLVRPFSGIFYLFLFSQFGLL